MRPSSCWTAVLLCVSITALAAATAPDPGSFNTSAKFSVDQSVVATSSAVATLEPRRGAPGYSWMRIYFNSFPLTAEDVAAAVNADVEPIKKKASDPKYYKSQAVIQLTVDQDFKVTQVDMSVPGHACTIAPFEQEVKSFLQDYQFDGKMLRLKSKGSFVCEFKMIQIPNQKFSWEIDLKTPVFKKAK